MRDGRPPINGLAQWVGDAASRLSFNGLRCDAWRFRRVRADYYDYLADMIETLQGHKTLRDLFDDDAERFGPESVRGRLARHWAALFELSGGDLSITWASAFPVDEVRAMRAAQASGAGALTSGLRDLARAVRVIEQARQAAFATLASAAVAMTIAAVMVLAIPLFTVPRLQQIFVSVPASYYGKLTRALFDLSHGLIEWGPVISLLVLSGLAALCWSIPRLFGPIRQRLDVWPIWRMYRDFHAIRFLSLLTISLTRQGNIDTRLRDALSLQAGAASPWLAFHLEEMIERVDIGLTGAAPFNTGMIDRQMWWYMSDLIAARGLAQAMGSVRDRVEGRLLVSIKRQATLLRWLLLLSAVGTLIGLALWHYAVIDELRRAMTQFYASH
jgi:type II secretory pathway component PulF